MALDEVKDEKVKKLAETLRNSGLAASDSEAVRMATEMAGTANAVQKGYEEQDQKPEVKPTSTEEVVARVEKQEVDLAPDQEDSELRETSVPSEEEANELYEQQAAQIDSSLGATSVAEAVAPEPEPEQVAEETSPEVEVSEPEVQPEPVAEEAPAEPEPELVAEAAPEPAVEPVSEPEASPEPEPQAETQEQTSQERPDDGYEVDKTVEVKTEQKTDAERAAARDAMAESKVDLSDVFNYGNR